LPVIPSFRLMATKTERGYGFDRNPWKSVVGTRGFEPLTPTASMWLKSLVKVTNEQ
jgi:hypothetical protein